MKKLNPNFSCNLHSLIIIRPFTSWNVQDIEHKFGYSSKKLHQSIPAILAWIKLFRGKTASCEDLMEEAEVWHAYWNINNEICVDQGEFDPQYIRFLKIKPG